MKTLCNECKGKGYILLINQWQLCGCQALGDNRAEALKNWAASYDPTSDDNDIRIDSYSLEELRQAGYIGIKLQYFLRA